jgi:hypothetical protein
VGDGVTVMAGMLDVDGVMVWEGADEVAVGVRDGKVLVGVEADACNGAANTE